MQSDLSLSYSLVVKQGRSHLNLLITRIFLVVKILSLKPTHSISRSSIPLMLSDFTSGNSSRSYLKLAIFGLSFVTYICKYVLHLSDV